MEFKKHYNELVKAQRDALKTYEIELINAINKQLYELRQQLIQAKKNEQEHNTIKRQNELAEKFASHSM